MFPPQGEDSPGAPGMPPFLRGGNVVCGSELREFREFRPWCLTEGNSVTSGRAIRRAWTVATPASKKSTFFWQSPLSEETAKVGPGSVLVQRGNSAAHFSLPIDGVDPRTGSTLQVARGGQVDLVRLRLTRCRRPAADKIKLSASA